MPRATLRDVTDEIIRLVDSTGKSGPAIAREMNISPETLRRYCTRQGRPSPEFTGKLAAYFRVHPSTIDPDAFAETDSFPWCAVEPADEGDILPDFGQRARTDTTPTIACFDQELGADYQVNPATTAGHVRMTLDMNMSVDRVSQVLEILAD